MPKLPRDVSAERLGRFLVRHGWTLARAGGRHAIFSKGGEHVAVPRHAALKTGTLATILKQTGLEERVEDL